MVIAVVDRPSPSRQNARSPEPSGRRPSLARASFSVALAALVTAATAVAGPPPASAAGTSQISADDTAFADLRFAKKPERFRFDRFRGKVLYVNFFTSWCPPCNREAPTLAKLARTYASRGLVVIGIDEGEDAAHALGFAERYHLPYPIVLDPQSRAETPFGEPTLPMHVFFDRDGNVAITQSGSLDATTAAGTIELLLGAK
jgi:cytochrome c biogenesis protein CcmG/thiol:disulfide interchange protein DsbE